MEHLIEKIDELTEENMRLKAENVNLVTTMGLAVLTAGGEIVIRRHHLESMEEVRLEKWNRDKDGALVLRASRPGWRT